MSKLSDKTRASEVGHGAVRVMCLFSADVLTQVRKWLDGHIALHEFGRNPIEDYEKY